jgi:acyl dehydratase
MPDKPPKYFENLRVGDRFEVGSIAVESEQMLRHAAMFDPQPIHLEDDVAREAGFEAAIASGWFTTSIAMKLFVARDPFHGTRILGIGADKVRWPNPTYAGDRLTGHLTVVELQPPRASKKWGLVRLAYVLVNQRGEPVLELQPLLAMPLAELSADVAQA